MCCSIPNCIFCLNALLLTARLTKLPTAQHPFKQILFFDKCLAGVCEVLGKCLGGFWQVSGKLLVGLGKVFAGF